MILDQERLIEHRIKVKVTEDLIASGVRDSTLFCPVAQAIHLHGYKNAMVAQDSIQFSDGLELPLPLDVTQRIQEYDMGGAMEPFDFDLIWYSVED